MARLEGKAACLFLQEAEILRITYGPDLPLGWFSGGCTQTWDSSLCSGWI